VGSSIRRAGFDPRLPEDAGEAGAIDRVVRAAVVRPARLPAVGSRAMHLRAPSVDQGVHAFVWSLVFFLYMWLGALAIDVHGGVAFVLSAVAAAAIFLFVRLRGGDYPGRR
jgi:hypothetical protein